MVPGLIVRRERRPRHLMTTGEIAARAAAKEQALSFQGDQPN
jgi:hypothetical protein